MNRLPLYKLPQHNIKPNPPPLIFYMEGIITNSDDNCVTYKLPQIHIQPGQHHKPLHTPHSTTKHHHTTNLSAFSGASKSGQTENRNPFLCSISVLQIVTAALRSCLFETSTTVTYEIDTWLNVCLLIKQKK